MSKENDGLSEPEPWPVLTVERVSGRWSNERAPKLGDRVHVKFNGLGTGEIIGFFEMDGWLGVKVRCDNRPDWHVKQNGDRHPHPMVFGAEVRFL